jgi:hypothetical protein
VIKFTRCQVAYGRWFSPGTPASSTTKTGRHDIAEILLKVVLSNKVIVCHLMTSHHCLSHIHYENKFTSTKSSKQYVKINVSGTRKFPLCLSRPCSSWGESRAKLYTFMVYSVSGKFHMGKIRCTRLAAASDNVYQLLAHGRWFSPDTPASYFIFRIIFLNNSLQNCRQDCSRGVRYTQNIDLNSHNVTEIPMNTRLMVKKAMKEHKNDKV